MAITAALVLFACTWFLILFIVLQTGIRTQQDDGEIVPGTHSSSPTDAQMGKRFLRTTLISVPIWLVIVLVILYGPFEIGEFNYTNSD